MLALQHGKAADMDGWSNKHLICTVTPFCP